MATPPRSVEIRSYQVGFGDCFLLSFLYPRAKRRDVLIDFGTMALPRRGRPARAVPAREHMKRVAADIERVCGGRLTAVVATHRHADHISGFGTDAATGHSGKLIAALRPKVVLQPWTEDPDAARDATRATRTSSLQLRRRFVAGLAAMHDVAAAMVALTERPPAWMNPGLARELRFLGEDNIRNRSAVLNLIAMGRAPGARAVWARHGSKSGLERLLPGVKLRVLGPPDLTQTQSIRRQRKRDADEFWHLLAGPLSARARKPLAHGLRRAGATQRRLAVPPQARWFRHRLDRMRGQQLLEIVRALDAQMNNTSLILLFEVFGAKILFPGDAQLENWSYALDEAPDRDATRALLAGVDVYKVGHHGSLNATPKQLLWSRFDKRGAIAAKRMTTVLSTLPGQHGKARDNTEVPRRSLLQELREQTNLLNTCDLPVGAQPQLCHGIEIRPAAGGAAPRIRALSAP